MTNQQHPITPPPELVQQWKRTAPHQSNEHEHYHYITLCAAQWGADQELEACCKWLQCEAGDSATEFVAGDLRSARRPKPPSLKEQALMALEDGDTGPGASLTLTEVSIIRRALEALPDDRT